MATSDTAYYAELANYTCNPTENDHYGSASVGSGAVLQELKLCPAIERGGGATGGIISGFLCPSSGSITNATITAGEAVLHGYHIKGTDDITVTFDASEETRVYLYLELDVNTKVYRPMLRLDSVDSTPHADVAATGMLIGRVTTGAATITSMVDARTQNRRIWGRLSTDGAGGVIPATVCYGSSDWRWDGSGVPNVIITFYKPFLRTPIGIRYLLGSSPSNIATISTTSCTFTVAATNDYYFEVLG